ncbi:MAG TPA: acyl-CoA dehydrogenase family protein [Alphaproteobacteria bacterium]|nr:acyl-CoA dehydrogenase family protein [Alphaproteobacteria bacterium]
MNFGFSAEQELLRTNARAFLGKECTSAFVRQVMQDPTGDIPALWKQMAELGWMGMLIPEGLGGLGLTMIDLVVVLEEMGRVLLPGAYFPTVVLGGITLRLAGNASQQQALLPRLASGALRTTLALTEPNGRWEAGGIAMRAVPTRDGYELNGTKLYVPEAGFADAIIVAVRTKDGWTSEDGISLFLLDQHSAGVVCTQLPTMDPTRRWYELKLDRVRVTRDALLGPLHGGWPILTQVIDQATAALCAEMCGAAERVLEMSVEYAKHRVAFGKPIGAYQAVKHKCADMLLQIENAKSLTYYAAWACQEGVPEASQAASMAKAYCTEALCYVVAEGLQIHGGIGFTWDHDMHLYYKRAQSSRFTFGDANWHRDRVARTLEGER